MNRKRFLEAMIYCFYSLLFSVGVTGCFVTAFELELFNPLLFRLILFLFSIVPPLLSLIPHGFWFLLPILAQGGYYLWQDGLLWNQIQGFGYTVSTIFNDAYGWPVIGEITFFGFDLFLILISFFVTFFVFLGIYKNGSIAFAVPLPILTLVLCHLTTVATPSVFFVFLLFFGIGTAIFTARKKKQSARELFFILKKTALPVFLVLSLLFLINPKEGYQNRSAELLDAITARVPFLEKMMTSDESGSDFGTGRSVNLRSLGARVVEYDLKMTLESTNYGTVYLRKQDFDQYTGTEWIQTGEAIEKFTRGQGYGGIISITTHQIENALYTPYYSTKAVTLIGGRQSNESALGSYQYAVSGQPEKCPVSEEELARYLALPEKTRKWAAPLVNSLTNTIDDLPYQVAKDIQSFVKNSAVYDQNTQKMSADYDDFARWFLEDADEGYCVHFATAATVLLRAAGIPARYVEGIMVEACYSHTKTPVFGDNAHAWAEYYDSNILAWRILEATPPTDGIAVDIIEGANGNENVDINQGEPALPETSEEKEEPQEEANTQVSEGDFTKEENKFNLRGKWLYASLLFLLFLWPAFCESKITFRRYLWNKGNPNQKALTRYRILKKLAKSTKSRLPKEVTELALVAKFSNRTVNKDELSFLDSCRSAILQKEKACSLPIRLLRRWLYFIG